MKQKDKNIIKYINQTGGATITKSKKICKYKNGYQVSIKDCHIIDDNIKNDKLINYINNVINQAENGQNIGIWKYNQKYYIDISENIKSLNNAILQGKKNNQISIFDFMNNTCIYLKK